MKSCMLQAANSAHGLQPSAVDHGHDTTDAR